MAILLQELPAKTNYSMRAISAANTLSPAFGGADQRLSRKGSRFAIDVSIPALSAAGCGMGLIADLLRGETETLVLEIPEHLPAVAYGAPAANGVSTGSVLAVKGLTPGAVIRKGKFLSIILSGQRFVHIVTAEMTVPAGGLVSLPIWPMLRRPTIDGAVIELAAPKIEGFIEPGQDWSINSLKAVGMSFTLKERE
ncbi:hypothetical protein [Brevundimonas sp. P7753]|uniref:hypothetical protein n=1 Tax=Brevundimonas sp. P7753 TaxID=2726982 RepID=UPI0015BBF389|nr:hypothetical protein [Brevundimonas sp. P7753]NWE54265.1 hypothetical protein [Brevundimonas sp. P7753]